MLVIVGSHDLWVTPQIISIVLGKMISTDVPVGVRVPRGSDEPSGALERFVSEIAPGLGRTVNRCRASTNTRGDVYKRDYEMVEQAVSVLAFFAPDREMDGGTGHVVQSALARGIPVEAYRMGETGLPELLGSDDGLTGGWVDPNFLPFSGNTSTTPLTIKINGTTTTNGTWVNTPIYIGSGTITAVPSNFVSSVWRWDTDPLVKP